MRLFASLKWYVLALVALSTISSIAASNWTSSNADAQVSSHTNNWAVLVCTSRFWFNYRHIANTLSFYYIVKKLGIPDSNIILMLPDDIGCNPRNPFPAQVFNHETHKLNVYGSNVEVDYRGYDVNVENFIRLMTDRLPEGTPRSKRLLTDESSNVLVFLTGHGGDGFIKFQDAEELNSVEVGDLFQQMHEKGRYNEVLFMVDTCQAASLYEHVQTPNVIRVASSIVGESSYSHHEDLEIGVSVIDRMTHDMLNIMGSANAKGELTLSKMLNRLDNFQSLKSHLDVRTNLFTQRDINKVKVTDFFGAVKDAQVSPQSKHSYNDTNRDEPFVIRTPHEASEAGSFKRSQYSCAELSSEVSDNQDMDKYILKHKSQLRRCLNVIIGLIAVAKQLEPANDETSSQLSTASYKHVVNDGNVDSYTNPTI
eukprot:CFRG7012T1